MYRTRTLAPQQPGHGGQQPGQAQPQRPTTIRPAQGQQQHQEMMRTMDRLMERLRETNRWMAQQRPQEGFRTMGRNMEQAGERLRDMLGEMDRLHQDPAVVGDRDRLRETERLRDRLHDMERQMEQAHDALRKAIGQP